MRSHSIIIAVLAFALIVSITVGYSSRYDDGQRTGYDKGYEAGYDEGYDEEDDVRITPSYTRAAVSPTSDNTQYVLNKNTKKFHHTWCSSVSQIAEKNKQLVDWTRPEIITEGYSPCGRCNP